MFFLKKIKYLIIVFSLLIFLQHSIYSTSFLETPKRLIQSCFSFLNQNTLLTLRETCSTLEPIAHSIFFSELQQFIISQMIYLHSRPRLYQEHSLVHRSQINSGILMLIEALRTEDMRSLVVHDSFKHILTISQYLDAFRFQPNYFKHAQTSLSELSGRQHILKEEFIENVQLHHQFIIEEEFINKQYLQELQPVKLLYSYEYFNFQNKRNVIKNIYSLFIPKKINGKLELQFFNDFIHKNLQHHYVTPDEEKINCVYGNHPAIKNLLYDRLMNTKISIIFKEEEITRQEIISKESKILKNIHLYFKRNIVVSSPQKDEIQISEIIKKKRRSKAHPLHNRKKTSKSSINLDNTQHFENSISSTSCSSNNKIQKRIEAAKKYSDNND